MLPQQLNVNAFNGQCSIPMPQSKNDPNAEQCVMWMGSKGSRNLIPSHLRNSVDKERFVTGTLRYFQDQKEYSARNVAFCYYRPEAVPPPPPADTKIKTRFRLKSICGRPSCVNPWHHAPGGGTRIYKKRPMKMAERLIDAGIILHPILSDSAYKKTIMGKVTKTQPHR